ncbi:PREDICTED: protein LMBR1L-like [Priapulus caudatus]|uniref:Protein LMBR1L-like n=1 Tax=Priapulus caudatus TaxID=37621 RepID=A0ABM1EWW6_PRICU|nr:PREDICTED: protein LMBR1L-like [Priapulus caudatus]
MQSLLCFALNHAELQMGTEYDTDFDTSLGSVHVLQGILGRIYETFIVLSLLAVVVLGLAFVASAIFDHDRWTQRSLLNIRNYYLPWLYSCISFLGVLLLLISTPWGFARLFTVVGELVVKPKFKMQLDEELSAARLEEADLRRKTANDAAQPTHALDRRKNGAGLRADDEIAERLQQQTLKCEMLERRWKTSPWRRNLAYPVVMLLLLSLTCISVLMVALHSLKLLMDDKALPAVQQINIGDASLSAFGPVGAAVEIILIIYFMLASLVGLYSLPLFSRLRPRVNDTTMTQIIGNCIVLLVLSSALPVLSRCLGE